jgi:pimeloyl-ACP methyl ester carboxylesterase
MMVVHSVEFRNSAGARLRGDLYGVDSSTAVVLAHGFTSDRWSRGRFPNLAEALNDAGYRALAFDFAGCGESEDAVLTLEGEADDLKCAIAFLRETGSSRMALFGISLGALICVLANPDVETMVLAGAPTGPIQYDWATYYSPEQLREWKETGRVTMSAGGRVPRPVKVDSSLLDAFAKLDPPELFGALRCPVLFVHGDADREEQQLLAGVSNALRFAPAGSRSEVIRGVPHGFADRFDEVVRLTIDWLNGFRA